MNPKTCEVKEILEKYQINKIWNFSPKYYNAYINKICGDYLYENSVAFKNSRFSWVKSFFWHSAFILLGAIMSWGRSQVLIKRTKKINKDAKIIVCPFCWRYVWFKRLPDLINNPIRIVYHPLFHYDNFKKNVSAYNREKAIPEFYRFHLKDIAKSVLLLLSNQKLNKCSRELDNLFGVYTGKFSRIFLFPILYGGFVDYFIRNQIFCSQKLLWLFDYDYDYKYIIFNNAIHKERKQDQTVHIQHGSFIKENPYYCNPVSDYTLCCSEREKGIIERENVFKAQIYVLGAPLQTFDDVDNEKNVDEIYDILVLLTDTIGERVELQRKILKTLDKSKYRIKVRFRPASQIVDKPLLEKYIVGMDESVGTTLLEDVLSSKSILSFSEDALYTAIRNNKPTIYITDNDIEKYYKMENKSRFFHIIKPDCLCGIDLDGIIADRKSCNYNDDKFVLTNFGKTKIIDIQIGLNNIITDILNSDGTVF